MGSVKTSTRELAPGKAGNINPIDVDQLMPLCACPVIRHRSALGLGATTQSDLQRRLNGGSGVGGRKAALASALE
jgi:hypothetical protein